MKKVIFLITYFFCVYAVDPEYDAEVELARKSACFFIKHTKSGCVIGRPNKQAKKLTTCKHDHDELLQGNLENDNISMFCIYDENKNILGIPFILSECTQAEYKTSVESIFNTLNREIKPKAMYGEITMNKGKPILSFYDKSKLWIADYSDINSIFFSHSWKKLELSQAGKQHFSNTLDVSGLKEIENKPNVTFRKHSWDLLNVFG